MPARGVCREGCQGYTDLREGDVAVRAAAPDAQGAHTEGARLVRGRVRVGVSARLTTNEVGSHDSSRSTSSTTAATTTTLTTATTTTTITAGSHDSSPTKRSQYLVGVRVRVRVRVGVGSGSGLGLGLGLDPSARSTSSYWLALTLTLTLTLTPKRAQHQLILAPQATVPASTPPIRPSSLPLSAAPGVRGRARVRVRVKERAACGAPEPSTVATGTSTPTPAPSCSTWLGSGLGLGLGLAAPACAIHRPCLRGVPCMRCHAHAELPELGS
eukprot:scaffold57351_cov50-Phaeocystis_antarctica.AAC.3